MKKPKFLKNHSAKLDMKVIISAIIGIILLVIILEIYAVLIPTAQSAGDSLNSSVRCTEAGCFYNATNPDNPNGTGIFCIRDAASFNDSCSTRITDIPLSNLFAGDGVVFIIIMAALLLILVVAYLKFKKTK